MDLGEAQALALANELHASAILIDEKLGRKIAKEQGFTPLGTLTVLELAAAAQMLDLKTAFDALRQTSFRITDLLLNEALARSAAHRTNR